MSLDAIGRLGPKAKAKKARAQGVEKAKAGHAQGQAAATHAKRQGEAKATSAQEKVEQVVPVSPAAPGAK